MLAEIALWLATPASRMARRLGLVSESVALWARGRRQRKAWAGHHGRCRALIAEVVAELPHRRGVAVLGSGLLRDIPLALLRERFERVLLVDAVHLPQIRLAATFRPDVTLVTRDLSGIMDWLGGERDGRVDPVADLVADETLDLVISANLMSQLGWPVEDWLEDNAGPSSVLPPDLPARCIAWHRDDLARFGCRVVLLTDVETVERDRAGTVHDRFDLMRGAALPPHDEGWDWQVVPFGEVEADRETVHSVRAWRDFGTACRQLPEADR
ncbi:hypothetical protein ASE63_16855 [Bosea sp. Root381]|uniref:hypothetical protein n=1 Tax=Bosea sp. Root381 TaxID=1736524 RepID=UPI0006F4B6CC|nr:hypothetical protein [Bosea sp. Root381]KRE15885.1 hypothetical protein ASE63_16855 [Bosea sp. Root381]